MNSLYCNSKLPRLAQNLFLDENGAIRPECFQNIVSGDHALMKSYDLGDFPIFTLDPALEDDPDYISGIRSDFWDVAGVFQDADTPVLHSEVVQWLIDYVGLENLGTDLDYSKLKFKKVEDFIHFKLRW